MPAIQTTDLPSRVDDAVADLVAALCGPGVPIKNYDDGGEAGETFAAIRSERQEEIVPGLGIWTMAVVIVARNIASDVLSKMAEVFGNAPDLLTEIRKRADDHGFGVPKGTQVLRLDQNHPRTVSSSHRETEIRFSLDAFPSEI